MKESDYFINSKIGQYGYKFIGSKDLMLADKLLLFCSISLSFSSTITTNETFDVLDRLLKTCSNALSEPFKSPEVESHLADVMKDGSYDFFGIDEYLGGQSACHLMESDDIYRVIENKSKDKT